MSTCWMTVPNWDESNSCMRKWFWRGGLNVQWTALIFWIYTCSSMYITDALTACHITHQQYLKEFMFSRPYNLLVHLIWICMNSKTRSRTGSDFEAVYWGSSWKVTLKPLKSCASRILILFDLSPLFTFSFHYGPHCQSPSPFSTCTPTLRLLLIILVKYSSFHFWEKHEPTLVHESSSVEFHP